MPPLSRPSARAALVLAAALGLFSCGPGSLPAAELGEERGLDPEVLELVRQHVARVNGAPGNASAHASLGLVYEANDLWEAAAASFANAVELEPGRALWRYHESIAVRESGRVEEADLLLVEAARELPDEIAVQYALATSMLATGRAGEAIGVLRPLLTRAPDQVELLSALGRAHHANGEPELALPFLQRAVRGDSSFREAHYALGLVMRALGDERGAREQLALGLGAEPRRLQDPLWAELERYRVSFVAQNARASQLSAQGHPGDAAALYERIAAKRPDDATVFANLGAARMEAGDLVGALAALRRAVELAPTEPMAWVTLAECNLRLNDPVEGMRAAERAVALAPELSRALVQRAKLAAVAEDWPRAYRDLRQAIEVGTPDAMSFVALTEVCQRLGRSDEALVYCRRAVELDPSLLPARVNLALLLIQNERFEEARRVVAELETLAPGNPRVTALAAELERRGR